MIDISAVEFYHNFACRKLGIMDLLGNPNKDIAGVLSLKLIFSVLYLCQN
ncbi:MAG: hypothetical protein BWX49_02435 [Bacteroidetes bacterium ADurb.Bin008]|jgi:hypothetical protein|nr:MAG: hypothetical protein BWX49_02435 [Bacteroidetes bacterium ADurb.Bin008]